MRLGCSTITFGPQPLEEALARIADLDFTVIDLAAVRGVFDHVRLDSGADEVTRVGRLVSRYGFEVAGLQTVPWVPDAIDDYAELHRRYTVAADIAQMVGARAWVVDANRSDPGESGRATALDRFKRTITMAAELAWERGLRLGIEAPHRGTLAETISDAVALLDLADLPQLGIDFDTSHALNASASTVAALDALGPRIIHVAIRDARRGGGFCTPGDGDFDFAEFFRLLPATGYVGDVTLELEPAEPTVSADERAREAVRARDHVLPLLPPG
jgi:sugar phosphate isomerase/epimerase